MKICMNIAWMFINQRLPRAAGILLSLSVCILYSLVPCIVLRDLKDAITTSNFICAALILSFAGILFIFKIFFFQHSIIKVTFADVGLLSLVFYIVINRYLLHDTQPFSLSFWELILSVFLYFIVKEITGKYLIYLSVAVLAGTAIQLILGYAQLFGYIGSNNVFYNVTGSFFNPGPYSCYLACTLPIIVAFHMRHVNYASRLHWSHKNSTAIQWMMLTFGMLVIGILTVTGSRTALLAGSIGLITLIGGHVYSEWAGKSRTVKSIISLVLVVSFIAFYLIKRDSADGRVLIWKISWNYIAQHPYIGSGYGLFQTNYMKSQAIYFSHVQNAHEGYISDNVYYAYNETLEFIFENGIIGGLILFALFLFISKIKGNSITKRTGLAGLITCCIIAQFSYPSQILPIRFMAVFYLALVGRYGKAVFHIDNRKILPGVKLILTGIITSVAIISGLQTSLIYQYYKKWNAADMMAHVNSYQTADLYYRSLNSALANNGKFLFDYGTLLASMGDNKEAVTIYNKAVKYSDHALLQTRIAECNILLHHSDTAETHLITAINMCPYKIYPKYKLLQLYRITGQNGQALRTIRAIQGNKLKVESSAGNDILNKVKLIADTMKLN